MQMHPFGEGMSFAVLVGMVGLIVAVSLVISIVICAILSGCFSRIPQGFRKMEPGMVWLLLIPCFNIVWNFFVYQRLADSYKAYFDSVGKTDVADCGKGIGLAYCICVACCLVPCLNYLAGPASLVLLVLYLIKAVNLKNLIPPQTGA